MRGKSAVYPVSCTTIEHGLSNGNGVTNNGFYSSPDEVQVTRPKELSPTKDLEDDPWQLAPLRQEDGKSWSDQPIGTRVKSAVKMVAKLLTVVGLLYVFVCSLDFLSNSFRLIAGRTTGSVLQNEYISNPVVGLMIGIMVTVLVQSSSTSTSIIVSMVNSGILQVPDAVPMIMGSNIGTSVTNTIVSLTQVGDRNVFRRAFAGATVHDMFNWLSVMVLLTVEVSTGMLQKLTYFMVESTDWTLVTGGKVKLLKVITEPFTKKVIQLDKKVLTHWSHNDPNYVNASLVKKFCKYEAMSNGGKAGIPGSCEFLFANTTMADHEVGLILLVIALVLLCIALILVVKILSSIMKGSIAHVIRVTLNADIPKVPWITGYLAIVIGALMTVLVQSSSIFTSTITPLIGLGLISVDRSYPLTLGSNIGTTTTALLASIAGEGIGIKKSIQIALVHLFFNIFGILIFYPIPFMRFPIPLAKALGNITAKYRWFAVLYLVIMFLLLPGFVFLLSLGGQMTLYIVGIPVIIFFAFVALINIMQSKKPSWLPKVLQTWEFVPLPLRSLAPYDKIITSPPCCSSCRNDDTEDLQLPTTVQTVNEQNHTNKDSNNMAMVEARTFFSVGPQTTTAENSSSEPNGIRRKTNNLEGVINPGLDVERM